MLHITQPTLSGQVKELEERYGTKLFVRHGRRIELTEIGKSAFNITRHIFRHEEEVEQLLQSARALTSGQLRVAADAPYIATPLLAQFHSVRRAKPVAALSSLWPDPHHRAGAGDHPDCVGCVTASVHRLAADCPRRPSSAVAVPAWPSSWVLSFCWQSSLSASSCCRRDCLRRDACRDDVGYVAHRASECPGSRNCAALIAVASSVSAFHHRLKTAP